MQNSTTLSATCHPSNSNTSPPLWALALLEPERVKTRVEAVKAQDSFLEFVRQAWHVIEPSVPLIESYALHAICDHLQAVAEDEIDWLVVNAPPGIGKSRPINILFHPWLWIHAPHEGILNFSFKWELASFYAQKSRALIASKWYQERWGQSYKILPGQDNKTSYANDKGGERRPLGVDGGMGFRARYGLLDDIQTLIQALSDVESQSVIDKVNGEILKRLNHSEERPSKLVASQQRLGKRDATSFLLETFGKITKANGQPRLDVLCLQTRKVIWDPHTPHGTPGFTSTALTRSGRCLDPRTVAGELLCPQMVDAAEVALREASPAVFQAQDQQTPVDESGALATFPAFRSEAHGFALLFPNASSLPDIAQAARDAGWQFELSADHGIAGRREVCHLLATHVKQGQAWAIDTYENERPTSPRDDARGIRGMLDRWGIPPAWIVAATGDVNLAGKGSVGIEGAETVNDQLEAARDDGVLVLGVRWGTPEKYAGSVVIQCSQMNACMHSGALHVDPRCVRLTKALTVWQGRDDGWKDTVDAFRYGTAKFCKRVLTPHNATAAGLVTARRR